VPLPDGDEFGTEAEADNGDVQFAFAHGTEMTSGKCGENLPQTPDAGHEDLRFPS
jgi:hypothetical protein